MHLPLSDCGEGTQQRIIAKTTGGNERVSNIQNVFITHLHADHVSGVVPLMLSLMGPSAGPVEGEAELPRLTLYGPLGLRSLIRSTLTLCYSTLYGKYTVHELLWPEQAGANGSKDFDGELKGAQNIVRALPELPPHESEVVGRDIVMDSTTYTWPDFATIPNDRANLSVSAAPILHRCPTIGYVFKEESSAGSIPQSTIEAVDRNAEALKEQGIAQPRSLLGKLTKERQAIDLPDGTRIEPPPLDIKGRKIVILGDTHDATGGFDAEEGKGMVTLAQDADVLVHEATNSPLPLLLKRSGEPTTEEEVRAKMIPKGHSTPRMAGAFAGLVHAKQLLLNHFSVRYDATPYWLRDTVLPKLDMDAPPPTGPNGDVLMERPERAARIMQYFELQATEEWTKGLQQAVGPASPAQELSRQMPLQAITTWDGYVFEVFNDEGKVQAYHRAQQERREGFPPQTPPSARSDWRQRSAPNSANPVEGRYVNGSGYPGSPNNSYGRGRGRGGGDGRGGWRSGGESRGSWRGRGGGYNGGERGGGGGGGRGGRGRGAPPPGLSAPSDGAAPAQPQASNNQTQPQQQ